MTRKAFIEKIDHEVESSARIAERFFDDHIAANELRENWKKARKCLVAGRPSEEIYKMLMDEKLIPTMTYTVFEMICKGE